VTFHSKAGIVSVVIQLSYFLIPAVALTVGLSFIAQGQGRELLATFGLVMILGLYLGTVALAHVASLISSIKRK